MGFLAKAALFALGMGALDKTVDRLVAEIEVGASRGQSDCTVSFTSLDIGVRNALEESVPIVINRIEAVGHEVRDVALIGIDSVRLTVRAATPKRETPPSPAPLVSLSPAVSSREHDSARSPVAGTLGDRWKLLIAELTRFAEPNSIGCPLVYQGGHAQGCAAVRRVLPDESERRFASHSMSVSVLEQMQKQRIRFEDIDAAIGIGGTYWKQYGLSRPQVEEMMRWKRLTTTLLGDIAEGRGGVAVDEWMSSEDVRTHAFVYFLVAWLRMQSSGLVPDLSAVIPMELFS